METAVKNTKSKKQRKQQAPGQSHRKGIGLLEAADLFATEEKAEQWLAAQRWPEGVHCPKCSSDNVQTRTGEKLKRPRYRCRTCKREFSVKTDTAIHNSPLPYRKIAMAVYQIVTNLKGVSSMKLHRDLGITQQTAWYLLMRLRQGFILPQRRFEGEVEVDEMFVGGLEKNKHANNRLHVGGGTAGKAVVAGMKSRETGMVITEVVDGQDKATLQRFVLSHADALSAVFTDEAHAYKGLPRHHEAVRHSVGEYVRGRAHTNGIESQWSMFKRAYHGTFHKLSFKHLQQYLNEFAGRNNMRPEDTIVQMGALVLGMDGKRITYAGLTSAEPTS